MSRTSDYSKQVEKDNLVTTIDIQKICSKINNESITPKELALYIEYKTNSKISIDEKTVRINLSKLCENSNGLLDISTFKGEKGKYSIKPEHHGILIALLSNNALDNRKSNSNFTKYLDNINSIINGIDTYLAHHDKEFIMSLPCYKSLLLEERLFHLIGKLFSRIINVLANSEPTVKISLITRFMQSLDQQLIMLQDESIIATEEKNLFESNHETISPDDVLHQLYFSKTLKEALIILLAVKTMDRTLVPKNTFAFTREELFIIAKRYHITFDQDKYQEHLDAIAEVENYLKDHTIYIKLVDKISKSLDLNNPQEQAAFKLIRVFIEDCIIKPRLSDNSYNNILNFMQESYATDSLKYTAEGLRDFATL